jgi:hypothetical protein
MTQQAQSVVYRPESSSLPNIAASCEWLMKEAAATG